MDMVGMERVQKNNAPCMSREQGNAHVCGTFVAMAEQHYLLFPILEAKFACQY